jgi:hypothetical protein
LRTSFGHGLDELRQHANLLGDRNLLALLRHELENLIVAAVVESLDFALALFEFVLALDLGWCGHCWSRDIFRSRVSRDFSNK